MSARFTISQLRQSACAKNNEHLFESTIPNKNKRVMTLKKLSIEKAYVEQVLKQWCEDRCIKLLAEHRFHEARKWRFDWAIPTKMIAVEYEGIMSKKSRHTTISGYNGDIEKYNAAQAAGWRVIRLTAINYKTIIEELHKFL